MSRKLDLDAIEAAEVTAGLDWTLENAHPLLMAVGPLVAEVRRLRAALDRTLEGAAVEVREIAEQWLYDGDCDHPVNDGYGIALGLADRLASSRDVFRPSVSRPLGAEAFAASDGKTPWEVLGCLGTAPRGTCDCVACAASQQPRSRDERAG